MDDGQVGRRFRALRHRLQWRQTDLADRAAVSAGVVSLVERGRLERVSLRKVRRIARELDAEFTSILRWRGGDLDRLVDEGHASMVGTVITNLRNQGWDPKPEVSYSEFGERGSIDILAWHPPTRSLLVVEVKTELVSVEETLRKHDVKTRLAAKVASQFAWRPAVTSRLLVLPNVSTPRRRVERHDAVLRAAYPSRGSDVREWLHSPRDSMSGLLFVRPERGAGAISRKRIRRAGAA